MMKQPSEQPRPKPKLCSVDNRSGKDLCLPYNGVIVVKFPQNVSGIPVSTFNRYLKQVANDICQHVPVSVRTSTIKRRANLVVENLPSSDPLDPIINYLVPASINDPIIARINFSHWFLSSYAGEATYKGIYHTLSHVICHASGAYHHSSSGVLNPSLTLIHRSLTDYDVDMLMDAPLYRELPSTKLRRGFI